MLDPMTRALISDTCSLLAPLTHYDTTRLKRILKVKLPLKLLILPCVAERRALYYYD